MVIQESPHTASRRQMLARYHEVEHQTYSKPVKMINTGPEVSFFLSSLAYKDIMTFVLQLNHAMCPRRMSSEHEQGYEVWHLDSDRVQYSEAVLKLRVLLEKLEAMIDEAPPDAGPRRFGNVSFRKWHKMVEDRSRELLEACLPSDLLRASEELEMYFLGSFGSPQRLDYGTGHELSFLAFLGCLWKLNFFPDTEAGREERGIVLGVFEKYFTLVRTLIKTYTLEPAGSHGVWGLDDNSFLPYVFGSAQLCPAISENEDTPQEGSIPDAPDPASVTKKTTVEQERSQNMYFSAIGFIYDVKNGPFWEHSPMLYDISGIRDGWGKINKGMLKMYNAEVLSKFPVVQHFPFGSLFRWEKDPDAVSPPRTTTHANSQALRNPTDSSAPSSIRPIGGPQNDLGTAAPWAKEGRRSPAGMIDGITRVPWVGRTPSPSPRGFANTQIRAPMSEPKSRLQSLKAGLSTSSSSTEDEKES